MAIRRRNPASITKDGKTRQLKNLGWLTRNWQEVKGFTFRKHPTRGAWDGVLIADLKGGGHFQSEFADYTVARGHFLDRPIFRGLELTTVNRNGTVVTEEIGSAAYRAVKGEALRQNPRRRKAVKRVRRNPTQVRVADVHRVAINRQGYSRTGQYFGVGAPVYQFDYKDENMSSWHEDRVRAHSMSEAKEKIKALLAPRVVTFEK